MTMKLFISRQLRSLFITMVGGLLVMAIPQVASAAASTSWSIAATASTQDEGTGMTFTITRDGVDIGETIQFDVSGTGANAANAADFGGSFPVNQLVTFSDNSTTKVITVTANSDSTVELDEGVRVTIKNPSVGSVSASSMADGIITNNDSAVISINAPSVAEGGTLAYSVTINNPVDVAVSVTRATMDGTAKTADSDYTAIASASATLFSAGSTTAFSINVSTTGDSKVELDETLSLVLSGLSAGGRNVAFSGGGGTLSGTGTITNNDTATISISSPSVAEGGTLAFSVTIDKPVDAEVTANRATAPITATAVDSDYTQLSSAGVTLFSAGSTTPLTINVSTTTDTKVEDNETMKLVLSTLAASGRSVQFSSMAVYVEGTGTINNNDTAGVTISDVTTTETDADFTTTFTVTLDAAVQGGFDLALSIADLGAALVATEGTADVTLDTTSVSFFGTAMETKSVTVSIKGDDIVEDNETFRITLGNVSMTSAVQDAAITTGDTATGTINNDDTAAVTIADVTVSETDANADTTFTATLSAAVEGGFTLAVSSANVSTDASPLDLSLTTTSISFTGSASETKSITVNIKGDDVVEDNETYTISFGAISATSAEQAADIDVSDTATGTINNDDTATVTVADVTVTETDADFTTTFTATLSAAVEGGFTLGIGSANVTTDASPLDFTLDTTSVSFAGTVSETESITVTIKGDDVVENNETYTISFGAISATSTEQAGDIDVTDTATGAINNDDSATLAINDVTDWERHASSANFTFTVTLSKAVEGGVKVDFTTADDSATTANSDYTLTAGSGGTALSFTGTVNEMQTINVPVNGDLFDERNASNTTPPNSPDDETFRVNLSNIVAQGGNGNFVTFADNQGVGTIQNDDYNTQIAISDGTDPSENGQNFNVNVSVSVVSVVGATTPAVPAFTGALTVAEGMAGFDVAKNSPSATFTDSLAAPLRNATLTGAFAASTEPPGPGARHFRASNNTTLHVVNNRPTFDVTTDFLTINGETSATLKGPNVHVQNPPSAMMPTTFTIKDFGIDISPDRGKRGAGTMIDNQEEDVTQDVRFNFTVNSTQGPLVFNSLGINTVTASPYLGKSDLVFSVPAGSFGIANVTVTATDFGVGGSVGEQTSAISKTFEILVYSVQPFEGDIVGADRGPRVFGGKLALLREDRANPTVPSMDYPRQNLLSSAFVDPYDVTVITNSPSANRLQYVTIDYESIYSAKGRGDRGLFRVDSVSLQPQVISRDQHFQVPVAVDLMHTPNAAFPNHRYLVADSEYEPNVGKLIMVHPSTGDQQLLSPGGVNEFFFVTGMTVAPPAAPNAGKIYVTDVGNTLGKTGSKNDPPRKIIEVNPVTGDHTVLLTVTNDYTIPITNGVITNLWFPVGIDVDPNTGDLFIADAYSKTIWKMPPMAIMEDALVAFSIDSDLLAPTHITINPMGQVFVADAPTFGHPSAIPTYAPGTRTLFKVSAGSPDSNATPFTQDVLLEELRGMEVIPPFPIP